MLQPTVAVRKSRYAWMFLFFVLVALWLPTPYYLYQPGTIEPLAPKVTVDGGKKIETGSFSLTTVLSIRANHAYILLDGIFVPHTTLQKEQNVQGDLTDDEYTKLLTHMMDTSQHNAVTAAMRAAGERVDVKPAGVFVTNVLALSKAKGVIQVGDLITAVDGQPVRKAADFVAYLAAHHQVGETINLTFTHNGTEVTKPIELVIVDPKTNQVGIGIAPEDEYSIDPARKITFKADDIGGPSAGLMFSLEILSQLRGEDLTRGYKIAGTGTIDRDGNVGQIGGIRDKIVAAHKANVDYFFCPADIRPTDANTKNIKDEAAKDKINVHIVPVRTLQDAVDFLEKLPPRAS